MVNALPGDIHVSEMGTLFLPDAPAPTGAQL